ncbi:transglutaminase-like cysteine peptidase [Malaciobacter mytili]|uniref:Transglutaminase n=1 Tax=Malaciobacter mytili LMG 24559 TaxID=1032238 RepID=A0AAX2AGU2_9BACT|nr:transglutaminase-like cysteine peptidase [Malaciobacter mytili]AXH14273.1 putative transglutaminase-like cysteine proteinase, C93 family [Malaciobacter mytili LMG 24559]RXI40801.1 transglutaminase [Malaciobacter mytili]RXK13863.1 transglutaminase [Malaciobacter mytili LMG 24559]
MKKAFIAIVLIFSSFISFSTATVPKNFTQSKFDEFKEKYGEKASQRLTLWDNLIENAKKEKLLYKLKMVNDFFNKITYKLDSVHWGKNDYWASPFEFLGTGAGDCEDYAIAKYYTLRQLGIPDDKLRIVYVKLLRKNSKFEQAHMVLTYYHTPDSTPIVLDNVNKKLVLANKRNDLKPVYSFNASGLWRAQNKGQTSQRVGNNNLESWKDLMSRF